MLPKNENGWLRAMCGFPKAGGSGCCGGRHRHAAGHQHGGGLQDKLHILAHIRHTGHVLAVQLLQGAHHVLAELLLPDGALGQVLLQIGPEVGLLSLIHI